MDNNIGKKFGKWTVISFSYKDKYNHPFYKCKCECGYENDVDIYRMKYGHSLACPRCRYNDRIVPLYIKRLRNIFGNMKARCLNSQNPSYKYYGGRGIKIYDDWLKNSNSFIEWALKNGYSDELTIDRIDNKGNYEPKNCRWVSQEIQMNNKRNNHIIFYKNEKYTISQFCKKFNLNYNTINARINEYSYTNPEDLLKPKLVEKIKKAQRMKTKYFVTLNGKRKSISEWCKEFNLSYSTVINRILVHNYTPEEAITKKLKNGKFNSFLLK